VECAKCAKSAERAKFTERASVLNARGGGVLHERNVLNARSVLNARGRGVLHERSVLNARSFLNARSLLNLLDTQRVLNARSVLSVLSERRVLTSCNPTVQGKRVARTTRVMNQNVRQVPLLTIDDNGRRVRRGRHSRSARTSKIQFAIGEGMGLNISTKTNRATDLKPGTECAGHKHQVYTNKCTEKHARGM
jgi:hypothetical protein